MTNIISEESVSDFFETILTHTPSSPETDYRKLCEALRKATGANWIWLWLMHAPTDMHPAIQLVARSRTANMPSRTYMTDSKSVSMYCSRTGIIEVIDEKYETWQRKIGNDVYSVGLIDELRQMGCKQFICVPILMPPLSTKRKKTPDYMPIICASVCIHYKNRRIIDNRTLHLIRRMGQLSAQAILNSYQALQRTILIELDQLAHDSLTNLQRDRELVREQYASDVTKVIAKHLQVKGVSLFYRDSLREGVQCLATTGLVWGDGRRVENASLVHYAPSEGRTGICYTTGKPMVLVKGLDINKPPKTVELIDGRQETALPATLYPIPLSKNAHWVESAPQSLGVIRCKFHHSQLLEGAGLCFDSIELQTLEFIAQQIAPVLETMELNIARERVVSVTKHDLYAPIGTIKHKTFGLRINKNLRLDGDFIAVNRYDIYDIGVCTMMCLNLVTQLDADPYSFIPNAKAEHISIEGLVIAPLKNMLVHYAEEENKIRLQFSGFEKYPDLWLDPALVQRAVFNILTNAVKYGKEGSTVRIVGRIDYDGYSIDFSNDGPGVADEDIDKIFVPKYRSPHTEKLVFGLGLGLSIAKACLEKCSCRLILRHPRNPTTFSLLIPRHLADSEPLNTGNRNIWKT